MDYYNLVTHREIYKLLEVYQLGTLFLAGNGFDIAHGIPTKYNDFRSYIVNLYPEALTLRNEVIYLEDFGNINQAEFAAEILLSAMDQAAGENWCNFEEALAYINFNSKLPMANHKQNETDEEDRRLMKYYLLYMDKLTSVFINGAKIWQDFFRLWLKAIQAEINSGKYISIDTLAALFSQSDTQYLTFNYTKTLQKLYGIKKVIHIHNRVGQNLIFGHEKDEVMYNQFLQDLSTGPCFGSSSLDAMVMSFRKDTISPLKKYSDFFMGLNNDVDKVFSYGFSYGKPDSIYIKKIINGISPNAIWYFTAFEARSPETLRIKKVKLRNYGFRGTFAIYD